MSATSTTRTGLFWLYVALAIIGAIVPYWLLLPWAVEHGFAPGLFALQLFETAPASIFSSDALLSAATFLIFAFIEGRRVGMRHRWIPPLIVVAIGLCCALPLFLAQRERLLSPGHGSR